MLTTVHKNFVKQIDFFNALTEDQFQDTWSKAHLFKLNKEDLLFSQGDSVKCFYLVFSGLVKLSRFSADGQEKVIEVVKPGETFAEAMMFLERPDVLVTASALNEAVIISFESAAFLRTLKNSPDTCLAMLGNMSLRIRGLIQEIDHLSVQTGRQRLSSYLLNLAGDNDHLQLSIPKSVLASRLSIRPETFSRIIKQLRSSETIQVDGIDIKILDREQLEEFALV